MFVRCSPVAEFTTHIETCDFMSSSPQAWFEMADLRRRQLDSAVWIPLRATNSIQASGEYATAGYKEEFFGAATIAVPVDQKNLAEGLGWSDVGISHDHGPYVQDGRYVPVDVAIERGGLEALRLVMAQRGNRVELREWHLHQDFVIALGLKRESDSWLAIDEGYEVVARLKRTNAGSPFLLEVRAEYLKDYLAARGLALYVNSYRNRVEVLESAQHIEWKDARKEVREENDRWKGRVDAIHEGGMPYGEKTAVFHVRRTDVDPSEDVPTLGLPTDGNIASSSWTREDGGRRLYRVAGELYRSEWVEPGEHSTRVRKDDIPSQVSFIVDATGRRELATALVAEGRWLWFRPEIVTTLAHRRGGSLSWYTRDTGSVSCSPDYDVHFGVNSIGLITVYAKDIGLLPEWQRRIWAGANITPEGGVSEELLASQVSAEPADTQAPEAYLREGLQLVDARFQSTFGIKLFRDHDQRDEILEKTHRFRATDLAGLCALAKDVARLTADSIDVAALQPIAQPPKDIKWRSLKSLENVLAKKVPPEDAHSLLSPLVGAYDLRHFDAHLPSSQIEDALRLLQVDRSKPFVEQGSMLLHSCVSALYGIASALEGAKSDENVSPQQDNR